MTDGRATRVVIHLGVAIELVTRLTSLIIPGVVIRALIERMKAQRQPLSAGCWEVTLSVLGSLAHQQGVVRRAAHRPCLCRIQRIDGHCSRGRQCRWHSKQDPALAAGYSARASGFGSPRRAVTRSAVTYGQPVTRQWNLRSILSHLLRQPEVGAVAADLPDARLLALARLQSVRCDKLRHIAGIGPIQ